MALVGITRIGALRLAANFSNACLNLGKGVGQFRELMLSVCHLFVTSGIIRLATFLFARGDGSLAILFASTLPIMVTTGVYISLRIVYAAYVAITFVQATTTTVGSPGMNTRKLSGQLIFRHIRNRGCEVVSDL